MIDGFYSVAFTGQAGSGFGMIVFRGGMVMGADVSGATFNGEFTENLTTGKIAIRVDVTMPAGSIPVQTGIPLASPATTEMRGSASIEDITNERVISLKSALGSVNVICRKVRDFPLNS